MTHTVPVILATGATSAALTLADVVNPTVSVAVVSAISGGFIAYLAYKQARKGDEIAREAGLATVDQGKINVVVTGLENLVTSLQNDNTILREGLDALNLKLGDVKKRCDELEKIVEELKREAAIPARRRPKGGTA